MFLDFPRVSEKESSGVNHAMSHEIGIEGGGMLPNMIFDMFDLIRYV